MTLDYTSTETRAAAPAKWPDAETCPLTEGEAIDAIFCILDDFDPEAQWRILVHHRLRHLHDYKDFPRLEEAEA